MLLSAINISDQIVSKIKSLSSSLKDIRNFAVIAHIDHGKTTLTDALISGAGFINIEKSGDILALDFDEEEKKRGITINSSNISFPVYTNNKEYLFNLIDTPGHVDFIGNVLKSLRVLDGALILVDILEGIMPQTENVIKLAIQENIKLVLFVNKVDRLIKELKLSEENCKVKIKEIVERINNFIYKLNKNYFFSLNEIIIGSAYDKWAIALNDKNTLSFSTVYNYYKEGKSKELKNINPVYAPIYKAIASFIPYPNLTEEKANNIFNFLDDENTNKNLKDSLLVLPVEKKTLLAVSLGYIVDPQCGSFILVKIFSKELKKGDIVWDSYSKKFTKIIQIGLYLINKRKETGVLYEGNIGYIIGLDVPVNTTICDTQIKSYFKNYKSNNKPVVCTSIYPKNTSQIKELALHLDHLVKEDPMIIVSYDDNTNEFIIYGIGELHLEVSLNKLKRNIEIINKPIIILFRESISKNTEILLERSGNSHNKFWGHLEVFNDEIIDYLNSLETFDYNNEEIKNNLLKLGFPIKYYNRIIKEYDFNLFINNTSGIQYLNDIMEMIKEGFILAMKEGIVAKQKMKNVIFLIDDAVIHVDPVHRGPAQIIPAIKRLINNLLNLADPYILDPIYEYKISTLLKNKEYVLKEISKKRGTYIDSIDNNEETTIICEVPLMTSLDMSKKLMMATEGRCYYSLKFSKFVKLNTALVPSYLKYINNNK